MKFVLHAPIDHIHPKGEFQSGAAVREIALALERSGASAAFVSEHPAPSADWLHNDPAGHDALDPFTSLAFIAALTTRLQVVSSAVVLPFRNPFITAKAAATLQVLSDYRFVLGVAVGYQREEFEALGVAFNQRGALTDEALETIRLAWKGGTVVKRGLHFNAVGNEPRPAPSPQPPIWVGGASDKALERAAKWGDGWMPHFSVPTNNPITKASSIETVDDFAKKLDRVMEIRAKLQKSSPFEVSVGAPSRPATMNRQDADKFLEVCRQLKARGATSIWTPLPAPSRAGYIEWVGWFAEEIIAKFK
jgi:probable F420-dependent oxidoreductase